MRRGTTRVRNHGESPGSVLGGRSRRECLRSHHSRSRRDTPDVLRSYARAHGARGAGWVFLTGTPAEIKDVAQRYGVFARKTDRGDVDHTFLTSLVDRDGALRVQYMGVRFDPDEMLRDLRSLLREGGR